MEMASGDELIEFEGYLVSITPRIRRGLPEYALKIITFGGESKTVYTREPKILLKPGLPIHVKAVLSRQSEKPRWMIDEIRILKNVETLEPRPAIIEEIVKGVYPIVSGKQENKIFSVPVEEDLLSKIPEKLPEKIYCIFLEKSSQIKLVEVLHEKEYRIFDRIAKLISELDKESSDSDRAVKEYLRRL